MSGANVDPGDMDAPVPDPFALDVAMVDALLDGDVAAQDAPPAYAEVLAVLRAADAPVRPDELDGGPEAIRRIFDEARRGPVPIPAPSAVGSRRRVGRWSVRAAVVAVVAVFTVGGGVALAATGSLPGPLQGAASRVLGVVGVTVPDGQAGAGDEPDPASVPSTPASTAPTAPSTVAPTTTGPITTTVPTAPPSIDPVPTTAPEGVPGRGDEVCAEASDGQCRAGETNPSDSRPGKPDDVGPPTTKDNPSVTAPGKPTTTAAPAVTQPPTTVASVTPTTPPHPGPGRP